MTLSSQYSFKLMRSEDFVMCQKRKKPNILEPSIQRRKKDIPRLPARCCSRTREHLHKTCFLAPYSLPTCLTSLFSTWKTLMNLAKNKGMSTIRMTTKILSIWSHPSVWGLRRGHSFKDMSVFSAVYYGIPHRSEDIKQGSYFWLGECKEEII